MEPLCHTSWRFSNSNKDTRQHYGCAQAASAASITAEAPALTAEELFRKGVALREKNRLILTSNGSVNDSTACAGMTEASGDASCVEVLSGQLTWEAAAGLFSISQDCKMGCDYILNFN